jgi:hypothetical protein
MQLVKTFGRFILPALLFLGAMTAGAAQSEYESLVRLDAEFAELAEPDLEDGVPDMSKAAIRAQRAELDRLRQTLKSFDVSDWPVERKVDYLLVWSKLNRLAFDHNVLRPWARDPLMYLYQVSRIPYTETPVDQESRSEFATELEAVPRLMQRAKGNLTEPVGELAKLAIFHLENFDGVGQRQPYRPYPPEGTIGWFQDLCGRLEEDHPSMLTDCREAVTAVQGYRDWLKQNLDDMPQSAAIGIDNLNWYLRHVRLLPYTVADLRLLGKREFHRFRFDYVVERNKNEDLEELALTRSAEQHLQRTRAAEEKIRQIIAEQDLLTIPDYMPDEFETDTYYSPRAKTNRHFWEELQFRNALNNHIHASVPGHRFDKLMQEHIENPIRRSVTDTARVEGWGTYLEELLLQAGIARENPRAQELFYIALIKRGSRFFAEIGMHSGEMTLGEANAYMIDWVPFMEENLGRYDLANYLRRPGSGSMYLLGKMQIEQLVSERQFQLGDAFDLGAFHDEFLSKGIIPVTLIRWEMTGLEDEVKTVWADVVGRPFPAQESLAER